MIVNIIKNSRLNRVSTSRSGIGSFKLARKTREDVRLLRACISYRRRVPSRRVPTRQQHMYIRKVNELK